MSSINWNFKNQPTVEISGFGAEFIAMEVEVCADGYLNSGPTYIYVDIMSVIYSISKPELTLKKKCNAIDYHAIHDSTAMKQ